MTFIEFFSLTYDDVARLYISKKNDADKENPVYRIFYRMSPDMYISEEVLREKIDSVKDFDGRPLFGEYVYTANREYFEGLDKLKKDIAEKYNIPVDYIYLFFNAEPKVENYLHLKIPENFKDEYC